MRLTEKHSRENGLTAKAKTTLKKGPDNASGISVLYGMTPLYFMSAPRGETVTAAGFKRKKAPAAKCAASCMITETAADKTGAPVQNKRNKSGGRNALIFIFGPRYMYGIESRIKVSLTRRSVRRARRTWRLRRHLEQISFICALFTMYILFTIFMQAGEKI
jgi:hypothetical protein